MIRLARVALVLLWIPLLPAGPAPAQEDAESVLRIVRLHEAWKGDLPGMRERGEIRVLVGWSHTHFFVDGGRPSGIMYELVTDLMKELNAGRPRGSLPLRVVFLPVPRDRWIPDLLDGRADLVAADLTITPSRSQQVDFSDPLAVGVSELVVTGPGVPPLASPDELAGRTLFVPRSSSYYESLAALNQRLAGAGREPVRIEEADEWLADEDRLQMVAAGLLPGTVVDAYTARLWSGVLDGLVVHEKAPVREGGAIAWAFRKGSPELAARVNAFVETHEKGTLTGNVLLKRYLGTARWARRALEPADTARFGELVGWFRRYGEQYGLDWVLLAAQGYQESGLDQGARSAAGAVGIMQLLPSTAAGPPVGIQNIDEVEANIHAGARYLRALIDQYFADPEIPPLDRQLFALAGYNAGPNRIRRLRAEAAERGFDPNRWFGDVEVLVAQKVGREPTVYVSNIYKYYVSYKLLLDARGERDRRMAPTEGGSGG